MRQPTPSLVATLALLLAGCGGTVSPLTPPKLGPTTMSAAAVASKNAPTLPAAPVTHSSTAGTTRNGMWMGSVGSHRVSLSMFNGNCQMQMDNASYSGNSAPGSTMGWIRTPSGQMQNVMLNTGSGTMNGFVANQFAQSSGFSGMMQGNVGAARMGVTVFGSMVTGQMGQDRVMLSGNGLQTPADADGMAAALLVMLYLDANPASLASTKTK